MGIRPVVYRAGATIAALATAVLGTLVAAAVQLVALLAIVVATLATETGWRRAEAPG